jgi:hypothetical protein
MKTILPEAPDTEGALVNWAKSLIQQLEQLQRGQDEEIKRLEARVLELENAE